LNRKASLAVLLSLMTVLLLADVLSKMAVRSQLLPGEVLPLIPGVIELRLIFNSGAAFGLFAGGGVLFVAIAFLVVAAIVVNTVLRPRHAWLEIISSALIAAGALGNSLDRLADGKVTDFFNLLFIDFAIFNVADACLTCGAVLLVIWTLFGGVAKASPAPAGRDGEGDGAELPPAAVASAAESPLLGSASAEPPAPVCNSDGEPPALAHDGEDGPR
jgi:signal peptidase II